MRKACIILLIGILGCSFSLIVSQDDTEEAIREQYKTSQRQLISKLSAMETALQNGASLSTLHTSFREVRIAYKRAEVFLAYYFELEVNKYNGPPIDFVEEEDPAAYQEPQGLQLVEQLIYPAADNNNRIQARQFLHRMRVLSEGLLANADNFHSDGYVMDAAMEAVFRATSLGMAGFDTPLSGLRNVETAAVLESVLDIVNAHRSNIQAGQLARFQALTSAARQYVLETRSVNILNFIRGYLNPLADELGRIKQTLGVGDNPLRYGVIAKTGNLFREEALLASRFMGDETCSDARVALGKKLFFEPLLSVTGKRSCASCHDPAKAFTDGLPTSLQLDGHSPLSRNSPTLFNASLQKHLFADSRQASLHQLILEVLGNKSEMNVSADSALARIAFDSNYIALHARAFPGTRIGTQNLVSAISCYVRTLISYSSSFDKYMRGNDTALSLAQRNGFNIFMGKAKCGTCHFVPFFNGSKPPQWYYQESEVLGVPAKNLLKNAVVDADPGRYAVLRKDFLKHAFKTPGLRHITQTAPYMHNGVFKTLEEVIDFYDRGGGAGVGIRLPNQTLPAERLKLTNTEKRDLIAFLGSLSDEK